MWLPLGKRSCARPSQLVEKGKGGRLHSIVLNCGHRISAPFTALPNPTSLSRWGWGWGTSGDPSPSLSVLLQPPSLPTTADLGCNGQQPTLVDLGLPPGSAILAKMAPPTWPGPALLFFSALPTPVSGLIKELCGLFMYGPSLIGVFVFSHYSQLDRAV